VACLYTTAFQGLFFLFFGGAKPARLSKSRSPQGFAPTNRNRHGRAAEKQKEIMV